MQPVSALPRDTEGATSERPSMRASSDPLRHLQRAASLDCCQEGLFIVRNPVGAADGSCPTRRLRSNVDLRTLARVSVRIRRTSQIGTSGTRRQVHIRESGVFRQLDWRTGQLPGGVTRTELPRSRLWVAFDRCTSACRATPPGGQSIRHAMIVRLGAYVQSDSEAIAIRSVDGPAA
jgi:hypothetical protein